jgi:hypothetical protein
MPRDTPQPYAPGQDAIVWDNYLIGTLPIAGADPAPLIGYVHANEFDGRDDVFGNHRRSYFYEGVRLNVRISDPYPDNGWAQEMPSISVERRVYEDEVVDGEALPRGTWQPPTIDCPGHESIRYDKLCEDVAALAFLVRLGDKLTTQFPPDAGQLANADMMTRVYVAVQAALERA